MLEAETKVMYLVSQTICENFPVRCYRKIQMDFLAHPTHSWPGRPRSTTNHQTLQEASTHSPPQISEAGCPVDTLILDSWPPELGDDTFLVLIPQPMVSVIVSTGKQVLGCSLPASLHLKLTFLNCLLTLGQGVPEAQAGINIDGRTINLRYADDTALWQQVKRN